MVIALRKFENIANAAVDIKVVLDALMDFFKYNPERELKLL